MSFRRVNRDDADIMIVGVRVEITFFDPNGPDSVDGMSTIYGTVVEIKGDPFRYDIRPIIVRLDETPRDRFPMTLDYFADSLKVEIPDASTNDAYLARYKDLPDWAVGLDSDGQPFA